MTARRGLSLLEAAAATLLLSVAVAGVLSSIAVSLSSARAVRDHERALGLARSAMEEVLATDPLPLGTTLRGSLGEWAEWEAVAQLDHRFQAGAHGTQLARIQLRVRWRSDGRRHSMALESHRRLAAR